MKDQLIAAAAMMVTLGGCQPSNGEQAYIEDGSTEASIEETGTPAEDTTAPKRAPLVTGDGTYKALGTEPFWNLDITTDRLTYTPMGGEQIVVDDMTANPTNEGWSYEGGPLSVEIDMSVAACSDGMSDIRYRHAVTVEIGGGRAEGVEAAKFRPADWRQPAGWSAT